MMRALVAFLVSFVVALVLCPALAHGVPGKPEASSASVKRDFLAFIAAGNKNDALAWCSRIDEKILAQAHVTVKQCAANAQPPVSNRTHVDKVTVYGKVHALVRVWLNEDHFRFVMVLQHGTWKASDWKCLTCPGVGVG